VPKPLPKLLPVLPYPASKSPPCGFVTASNPAHKRPKFPFKTYHRRHSSSHWCLIPYTRARAHSRARSLSLSLCRQGSLSKHDECPKEKQHKPRIILLRNPSSLLPRLPRPPPPPPPPYPRPNNTIKTTGASAACYDLHAASVTVHRDGAEARLGSGLKQLVPRTDDLGVGRWRRLIKPLDRQHLAP
jgi:hypothetical protein